MTLQDLFNMLGENPKPITLFFISIPLLTFALGLWTNSESTSSFFKYAYSILIYIVCIPGIFSLTLLAYILLIEQSTSIQNLSIFGYFLPPISMFVTFLIAKKSVDIRKIPGFNSMAGLMMMLVATFILMLIIQKTRIWVVFHGSIFHLLILFVILFIVIKIGWDKMIKKQ